MILKNPRISALMVFHQLTHSQTPPSVECPPESATALCQVQTLADSPSRHDQLDRIAVEAPLEVRINGKAVTVLMRTPGHDEELVRGFLFSEGMIASAADILAIERPEGTDDERDNVILVALAASRKDAVRPPEIDRLFYSSSSCGVCGKKTIASLAVQGPVCESRLGISRAVLAGMPEALRAAQPAFAVTGGVHASALFTPDGKLVAVREDVGRHNALDKVIGWALTAGKVPLADHGLLVSGRVSYEIVQKAIVAELPIIAAVGAPSSLAVELAGRFKITLIGFLRHSGMNVYTMPERVID